MELLSSLRGEKYKEQSFLSLLALPLFEKEAKKRQGQRTDLNITALMPEGGKGEAREKAAVLFDVSPRYIQEAKKLQREHPELIEEVKKGNTTLTKLQKSFLPPPEKDYANQMSIRRISELIEQKRLFCPKCKKHELVWKCCGEKIETTLEKIIEKQKKIVQR